jgi:ABC-type polysaccharide/polyol phosphate export permease
MKNKNVFLTMLISQILFGLFTIIWLFVAIMSVMMFDNPDSEKLFWPVLMFIVIWLYPVALIVSIIVSWVLYRFNKMKTAVTIAMVPLFWVLPLLGFLIYANVS